MKESVGILLKKAGNDLKDAKILYNSNEASAEGICFHCQQAVEKYLKAHLVYNNKEINKTHDISELLEYCKSIDNVFSKLEKLNIDDMTNYAVIVRYDDIIEPTREDAKEAISIAEQVKTFINEKINIEQSLSQENSAAIKPAQEPNTPKPDDFTRDLQNRLNKNRGIKR